MISHVVDQREDTISVTATVTVLYSVTVTLSCVNLQPVTLCHVCHFMHGGYYNWCVSTSPALQVVLIILM